ncbi:MAG: alkaline phosphatase family protein [Thermoplasmata archaeon]
MLPQASPHYALILLDGLGDRPHPETGRVSPVEAAKTPHLDRLLALGQSGQVVVVGPEIAPESDAGVLALLGYDPQRESPGRGVLEALGVGVPLGRGDVALRINFATTDGRDLVIDSRVGRTLSTEEARELSRSLTAGDLLADQGIHAEVRATVGHRGVLWLHPLRDGDLSPNISNSDPFYDRLGGLGQARTGGEPRLRQVEPLDDSNEAKRTARAINTFLARVPSVLAGNGVNARRALAGRKVANGLLTRNAGSAPPADFPTFESRHGLPGAAVTEMPVERGIARLLGLKDRYVGPMGPDLEHGYAERARVTRQALADTPFVYVHLKGPDEPGHDGDAVRKQAVVESIDRWFFGPFLDGLDLGSVRLAVTADHATPCILKAHSSDPVPWLLAGTGIAPEPPPSELPQKFSERRTAAGMLGTRRGAEVLPKLLGVRIDPA